MPIIRHFRYAIISMQKGHFSKSTKRVKSSTRLEIARGLRRTDAAFISAIAALRHLLGQKIAVSALTQLSSSQPPPSN